MSEALAREAARLRRTAERLHPHTARARALPSLIFVTDPDRVPDPLAAASRLPKGAGVIFRGFGRADAADTATALARLCRARGLKLLIGADSRLAASVGANGVHLPERLIHLAPCLRRVRPGWRITAAAHSAVGLRRARLAGVDAALLSPVFASASASARGVRPLGPMRFAAMAQDAGLPVYALGGVDARTAVRVDAAWGVAAIEAFSSSPTRSSRRKPGPMLGQP